MIDDIAALWTQEPPLSLSAIAHELGLTRGSVAGKIARSRRNGDERFPTRPVGPRPTAARQRSKPVVAAASPNRVPGAGKTPRPIVATSSPTRFASIGKQPAIAQPQEEGLSLWELEEGQCRWALNSAGHGLQLRFCALPIAHGRYCARHAAMAHSSVSATSPFSSPRAPGQQR